MKQNFLEYSISIVKPYCFFRVKVKRAMRTVRFVSAGLSLLEWMNLNLLQGNRKCLFNMSRKHPEVTDVLFTGGDPLIMKTKVLEDLYPPAFGCQH